MSHLISTIFVIIIVFGGTEKKNIVNSTSSNTILHSPSMASPVRYNELNNPEMLLALSVALRDEDFRNGSEINENLDAIVLALKTNLDSGSDETKTETLKVLINLTADSDANRAYLISRGPMIISLWHSVIGILGSGNFGLGKLTVIFISQFVTNTTDDRHNVEFLSGQLSLLNPLIMFLGSHYVDYGWNADEWCEVVEVLAEIMNEYQDIIQQNDSYKNVECLNILIKILREHLATSEDTEYLGHLVDCITVLTSFEDFPGIDSLEANRSICSLIPQVPSNIKDGVKLKRKLFAISGSISSMVTFGNFGDVRFSIDAVKNLHQFSDPYYLSACLINIGNYIVSRDKRDIVESAIGNTTEFVNDVFLIRYNDIVQLQCFHCLNNLLTAKIAHDVVQHQTALQVVASMIVANQQYYPEVVRVFVKFLKKLLSLSMGDEGWRMYGAEFWQSFNQLLLETDSAEIQLLALQSYLKLGLGEIDRSVADLLIHSLFSTEVYAANTSVELPFVLAKLKTVGMFNHYLVEKPEERIPHWIETPMFYIDGVTTIFEFMDLMSQQLSGGAHHQAQLIFHNALAFAAATTLNVISAESFESSGPKKGLLSEKCKAIIRQEPLAA